jgi:hypothetical protein
VSQQNNPCSDPSPSPYLVFVCESPPLPSGFVRLVALVPLPLRHTLGLFIFEQTNHILLLILQLLPRLLERCHQVLVVRLGILKGVVRRAQVGIEVGLASAELLDGFFELVNPFPELERSSAG